MNRETKPFNKSLEGELVGSFLSRVTKVALELNLTKEQSNSVKTELASLHYSTLGHLLTDFSNCRYFSFSLFKKGFALIFNSQNYLIKINQKSINTALEFLDESFDQEEIFNLFKEKKGEIKQEFTNYVAAILKSIFIKSSLEETALRAQKKHPKSLYFAEREFLPEMKALIEKWDGIEGYRDDVENHFFFYMRHLYLPDRF